MAQIAKSLAEQSEGSLLSNTKANPQESLKAITLISGKELPSLYERSPKETNIEEKESNPSRIDNVDREQGNLNKEKDIGDVKVQAYQSWISYPTQVRKGQ